MLGNIISPDFQSYIEATSDSDRRKLISFLTEEPFSVVDLAENIGENPAAIMRHLGLFIEANIVKAADQDGKTFYRFNSKNLELMARRHYLNHKIKLTYLQSTCLKTSRCSYIITLGRMAA